MLHNRCSTSKSDSPFLYILKALQLLTRLVYDFNYYAYLLLFPCFNHHKFFYSSVVGAYDFDVVVASSAL